MERLKKRREKTSEHAQIEIDDFCMDLDDGSEEDIRKKAKKMSASTLKEISTILEGQNLEDYRQRGAQ